MNKSQLTGASFPEANGTLSGRPLTVSEGGYSEAKDVKDLPIYRDGTIVISKWKLRSFWERVRFLLKGEIYVVVLGMSHPPIALRVDKPFEEPQK